MTMKLRRCRMNNKLKELEIEEVVLLLKERGIEIC